MNINTARPLDIGRDRITMSAEGLYEVKAKKVEPQVAVLANHLFNDKFGVSLGVNYQRRNFRSDTFRGFGFENGVEATRTPKLDYNRDGDFNDTLRFNHEAGTRIILGNTKRVTAIGAVQARPADWIEALWRRALFEVRHQADPADQHAALHQHHLPDRPAGHGPGRLYPRQRAGRGRPRHLPGRRRSGLSQHQYRLQHLQQAEVGRPRALQARLRPPEGERRRLLFESPSSCSTAGSRRSWGAPARRTISARTRVTCRRSASIAATTRWIRRTSEALACRATITGRSTTGTGTQSWT
ncbi:hypothetical protein ACRAWD_13850 [Caulobacter segnis]